jgi:hypothetical protein
MARDPGLADRVPHVSSAAAEDMGCSSEVVPRSFSAPGRLTGRGLESGR